MFSVDSQRCENGKAKCRVTNTVGMKLIVVVFCWQDEITEMQRKLKIMNHQIDQLKEEITSKEQALVKEHLDRQRVEKEKDNLKVPSDEKTLPVLCLNLSFRSR